MASEGEKQVLKLVPKGQQSLAVRAIEVASGRRWMVTEMRSDPGRLDEVFRQVTTTADVAKKSA